MAEIRDEYRSLTNLEKIQGILDWIDACPFWIRYPIFGAIGIVAAIVTVLIMLFIVSLSNIIPPHFVGLVFLAVASGSLICKFIQLAIMTYKNKTPKK